jgi:electron transfer flavoprotein alpha subunit/NAD-dependent dihydropyrimidine dehydrogenase PreA subunit
MELRIDRDVCVLCNQCIPACPFGALERVDDRIVVGAACTLCGACLDVCPVDAMSIPDGDAQSGRPEGYSGVWVYGEMHDSEFHHVVYELIGKGAELAEALGCPLGVVVLGSDLPDVGALLAGYPVSDVYVAEHAALAPFRDGPAAAALAWLIEAHRPEIVLAGATSLGRSMIPRVATLCATGLTADCTRLEIEPETGDLLQTRPAFGGNVMATIVTRNHRPQMATVRPKVMTPPERADTPQPIVHCTPPPDAVVDDVVEVLDSSEDNIGHAVNIAEADVLVAGGRGIGGADGFTMLAELAELLGGELAASRAAVDAGWVPCEHQVGQTGKTVQPRLYIAVGISGAVQHAVGMQSSEMVVAINADADAPIFNVADYGIVGDWRAVVPQIIEQLRTTGGPQS